MSEGGGSAGPDIGPDYQNSGPASYSNPPSQPPTPSSTVQDPPNYQNAEISENSNESKPNLTNLHSNSASGLPPFSSFAASDVTEGLGGRLAGDGYLTSDGISSTRVMELSGNYANTLNVWLGANPTFAFESFAIIGYETLPDFAAYSRMAVRPVGKFSR